MFTNIGIKNNAFKHDNTLKKDDNFKKTHNFSRNSVEIQQLETIIEVRQRVDSEKCCKPSIY